MLDLKQLVRQSEEELGQIDIAAVHLACAVGLPGAEALDIAACLRTLDEWAAWVRQETNRCSSHFLRNPAQSQHSSAVFRVEMMVTVLQEDKGVRYNPGCRDMSKPPSFRACDNFLFGILDGEGGTCASLPVLYAAVGRRLGYPLKLVRTLSHLFCRWDEPDGERFNIDASCPKGFHMHPDEYYLSWPEIIPREEAEAVGLLRSLTRVRSWQTR